MKIPGRDSGTGSHAGVAAGRSLACSIGRRPACRTATTSPCVRCRIASGACTGPRTRPGGSMAPSSGSWRRSASWPRRSGAASHPMLLPRNSPMCRPGWPPWRTSPGWTSVPPSPASTVSRARVASRNRAPAPPTKNLEKADDGSPDGRGMGALGLGGLRRGWPVACHSLGRLAGFGRSERYAVRSTVPT